MPSKFIRQDSFRYSRLGKNRKKLQKWRRPKGRHSKMREHRKSYPASPTVGYKTSKKFVGRIKGFTPVIIQNIKDLNKLNKDAIAILSSRLGSRKKMEIIRKLQESKFKILNVKTSEVNKK